MSTSLTIFLSLLGGILPTLLWLWFWRKEDRLHPEPRKKIALTFLGGILAVAIVLPIEKLIFSFFGNQISNTTISLWASTEELVKFIIIYLLAFRSREMDEPIDATIYMITGALGFSAIENSLFIYNVIENKLFIQSFITGNMRFMGATLLHTASSAIIGILFGLVFYKKEDIRKAFLVFGLILSILLHSIFNLLIIRVNEQIFFVFAGVWFITIILMILMEKVKKVHI